MTDTSAYREAMCDVTMNTCDRGMCDQRVVGEFTSGQLDTIEQYVESLVARCDVALLHLIRRGNCPMFRPGRSVDCAAGHGPCSDGCLPILREWAKREALTDTPDTCPTCGWPRSVDRYTLTDERVFVSECPSCGLLGPQLVSDEGTNAFLPYDTPDTEAFGTQNASRSLANPAPTFTLDTPDTEEGP